MREVRAGPLDAATLDGEDGVFYRAWANLTGVPANIAGWSAKTPPSGDAVGTTDSQTLSNKTISAALNTISALTVAMFAANVFDTDATLAANSAMRIPAQSAVKSYVDNALTGLRWKASVLCATTASITLSGEQTIDGVLTSGSRVLVKNQSTASQNGIYVSGSGTWTRAADADSGGELVQATTFVEQGTVNADTQWTCTNNSITLGSTSVAFAQVSGAGTYSAGTGLGLSGNQFSITDPDLVAFIGLTSAADRLPYFSGSGSMALATFTTFGRALAGGADAAAGRTTLELGTLSTQNAGSVAITGGTFSGITSAAISGAAGDLGALTVLSGSASGGNRVFAVYRDGPAGDSTRAFEVTRDTSDGVKAYGQPVWHSGNLVKGAANSTDLPTLGDADGRYPRLAVNNVLRGTQTLKPDADTDFYPVIIDTFNATPRNRGIVFKTNSLNRWAVVISETAEAGSDAGSNFALNSYTDAGAFLGQPISINRSTGVVRFDVTPTVAGSAIWNSGNDGASSGLDADLLDGLHASSFQGIDATLTALAALNSTAGLVEQTGSDAFTKRAIGAGTSTSVPTRADGDGRWFQLGANNTTTGIITSTGQFAYFANWADDGAGAGPIIQLLRTSTTPAANDIGVDFRLQGKDSAGNNTNYVRFMMEIASPTDGAEYGNLLFRAMVNGSDTVVGRIGNGWQFGAPTGGFKGLGSLNAAAPIYVNNAVVAYQAVAGVPTAWPVWPGLWGAVGDGSTDDTTAINTMFAAIGTSGTGHVLVRGFGKTYKVGSTGTQVSIPVGCAGVTIEDIIFDGSSATGTALTDLILAQGTTVKADASLGASLTQYQKTITLPSTTSVAARQLLWVHSTSDYWDNTYHNVLKGELHEINSISGSNVDITDQVRYAISSARQIVYAPLDNLTFRRCTFIGKNAAGATTNQGLRLRYCRDFLLEDCKSIGMDTAGVRVDRCMRGEIRGGYYGYSKGRLAFGVSIVNGSVGIKTTGTSFVDCSQGWDLGDANGVNFDCDVSDCKFHWCWREAISTHSASDNVGIYNNSIYCNANFWYAVAPDDEGPTPTCSGMILRGVNHHVDGNRIWGAREVAIIAVNYVTATTGLKPMISITNNQISDQRSVDPAIEVYAIGAQGWDDVNVSGNKIDGTSVASSIGVQIGAVSGDIRTCTVANNTVKGIAHTGFLFETESSGWEIKYINCSGNIAEMDASSSYGYRFLANTAGTIYSVTFNGNTVVGAVGTGVASSNDAVLDAAMYGNNLKSATTKHSWGTATLKGGDLTNIV